MRFMTFPSWVIVSYVRGCAGASVEVRESARVGDGRPADLAGDAVARDRCDAVGTSPVDGVPLDRERPAGGQRRAAAGVEPVAVVVHRQVPLLSVAVGVDLELDLEAGV